MHGPRATRLVGLAELKPGDIVLDIATGKQVAMNGPMATFAFSTHAVACCMCLIPSHRLARAPC